MLHRGKNKKGREIEPDEIFLDSSNLPDFDVYQFEGRLEKSISKRPLFFLGAVFLFAGIFLVWELATLQISEGEKWSKLAENNRLRETPLFSERGIIVDRTGKQLAWNESFLDAESGTEAAFSRRAYAGGGLAHLVGYVRYPRKDRAGFYFKEEISGEEGVEESHDELLRGENGLKLVETNALGELESQNILRAPRAGDGIALTADARISGELYRRMEALAWDAGFTAGAAAILDVHTGEALALSSFPEYDQEVLSDGSDAAAIEAYRSDEQKPFLNRAVSGLYAPGSIIKLVVALAALEEDIIDPDEKIVSTGSLRIPNPYFPGEESVFYDWKPHGPVDMVRALAVSSNVYFYEVGGGYGGRKGLGIEKIGEFLRLFGFGDKTGIDIGGEKEGVIPSPHWKREVFGDEWRLGDTYNTVIGQYGLQVTPLQAARAVAAIANGGTLVVPRVRKDAGGGSAAKALFSGVLKEDNGTKIDVDDANLAVVREGMRRAVIEGTASGLAVPGVSVAAKTGTAEVGIMKKHVNSWAVGFFPYEAPRYAFAVVMERGPRENLVGALFIVRGLLEWMQANTPEYFNRER